MDRLINPARVDFVTLRLFCAVAQSGSITKGAQACSLALSAASRRLADFESASGTRLLERSAQGVSLTPAGHVALQHAVRLFQGFEQLSSELGDYSSGVRGHVRLWANMSSLTEYLPACLGAFMKEQPDIRVEVEEQLSGDITRALVDGLADIGIFADNTPTHGLSVEPFREDLLVVLCSRKHALSRRKRVRFAECLDHEFVGLNRGSSLLELTSRAAQLAAKAMKLRVQVRSFDAMCQMIEANLGIGVLPAGVLKRPLPKTLAVIELNEPWARRRLLLGTSTHRERSPAALLLWTRLLQSARETSLPARLT